MVIKKLTHHVQRLRTRAGNQRNPELHKLAEPRTIIQKMTQENIARYQSYFSFRVLLYFAHKSPLYKDEMSGPEPPSNCLPLPDDIIPSDDDASLTEMDSDGEGGEGGGPACTALAEVDSGLKDQKQNDYPKDIVEVDGPNGNRIVYELDPKRDSQIQDYQLPFFADKIAVLPPEPIQGVVLLNGVMFDQNHHQFFLYRT